jgi:hypothetical protein
VTKKDRGVMQTKRTDVIATKKCKCGCGGTINIKKWHFDKGQIIPKYICGHNPATKFKFDNKIGWKGGLIKCNGYNLIYCPDHPKANAMGKGYIRHNRYIMEKHLGRYLNENEIIHHKNGITDDDRIENLEVLSNSEHLSYHHKISVKKAKRDNNGKFTGRCSND